MFYNYSLCIVLLLKLFTNEKLLLLCCCSECSSETVVGVTCVNTSESPTQLFLLIRSK